jgi:hypothetical protein
MMDTNLSSRHVLSVIAKLAAQEGVDACEIRWRVGAGVGSASFGRDKGIF